VEQITDRGSIKAEVADAGRSHGGGGARGVGGNDSQGTLS
jgi:hypothetical protein